MTIPCVACKDALLTSKGDRLGKEDGEMAGREGSRSREGSEGTCVL